MSSVLLKLWDFMRSPSLSTTRFEQLPPIRHGERESITSSNLAQAQLPSRSSESPVPIIDFRLRAFLGLRETFHSAGSTERLNALKLAKFTSAGRELRIARSLQALDRASLIELSRDDWGYFAESADFDSEP